MSYAAPHLTGQDASPLASLSITHVSYDPSDPISLVAAYLSLVPQALMIVYAVLIFSHRELEIILACAGQLGCEAINYVLKRVIKEARPSNLKGKGYGMPSSHTQFMFFFATYISLWIALRNKFIPKPIKTFLLLSLSALAVGVAGSRVYLHYHTVKQVLVGSGAGVVIGLGWFVATALMRIIAGGKLWDFILENEVAKLLYVKDECTTVDLHKRDWDGWWAARVQKKKAMEGKKGL
ncbi:Dolichyldiphosphatase 1 [Orbilia javanica]|uniref:Dolichyldiphosphatase n=1 Tax=Orbilia javanica TaxID=47235 RepID=A0AAN8MI02_9PEZI